MKGEEALSYAYDFIRILAGKTGFKANDIILFGSVARGDFDRESDVDIFVNVPAGRAKSAQKAVNGAQNEFEIYSRRTWKLKGIDLPIKCVVGDLNSKKWSALRREIISSGISLYGKYKELPKGMKRFYIFSFSLAKLKHKNRVNAVRKIYGYSAGKGKKLYKQSGILDEVKGEKINPGVIMAPAEGHKRLFEFFKSKRVSFKIREVWTG